jgi:hypothetical protein
MTMKLIRSHRCGNHRHGESGHPKASTKSLSCRCLPRGIIGGGRSSALPASAMMLGDAERAGHTKAAIFARNARKSALYEKIRRP